MKQNLNKMPNPIVTKEASVFYHTIALLKVCKRNILYLVDSNAVNRSLKQDLKVIANKIAGLERVCSNSIDGTEREAWQKEWTDKDYEIFAGVFSLMADMDEEKRSILEEFAIELNNGNIRVELDAVQK